MDNEKSFKGLINNLKPYIEYIKLENLNVNKKDSKDQSIVLKSNKNELSFNNKEEYSVTKNKISNNNLNNSQYINSKFKINHLKTIKNGLKSVDSKNKLSFNFNNDNLKRNSKLNKNNIIECFGNESIKSNNYQFNFLNRLQTSKFNKMLTINKSQKIFKNPELELNNESENNESNENIKKYENKIKFENKKIFPTNYLNKINYNLKKFYLLKEIKITHLELKKTIKRESQRKIMNYFSKYFTNKLKKKNKSIIFMKISYDYKYLLITDNLSNIIIYDLLINNYFNKGILLEGKSKYSYLLKYTNNNYEIICIEWSANSKSIIVSNSDRSLKIYDLSNKNNVKLSYKFDYWICCLGVHPSHPKIVAIACSDKILRIIKLKNAKVSTWDQNDQFITSLDFNPNGKKIAITLLNGIIKIYKYNKLLKLKKEFYIKTKYIYQIKFINDYQVLIRNKENLICLVNTKNNEVEQKYKVPFSKLSKINLDFNNNLIVGINKNNNIILWNKINDYVPFINPKYKIHNKDINRSIDYFQPFKDDLVKNVCFIPRDVIDILNENFSTLKIKFGLICANYKSELKIFYELH